MFLDKETEVPRVYASVHAAKSVRWLTAASVFWIGLILLLGY